MKKVLWVLLAVLVLTAAGCGMGETPENTAAPLIEVEVPYQDTIVKAPYEGVELTFRSIWKREEPQAQVLVQAEQFFEKQTGAVVTVFWPEKNTPSENVQPADILQISAADFAAMPAEEMLDLTQMAEKANYDEKSHETLRRQIEEQCGYLGAVAQVPYLGGVYYNTEIFEQCALTNVPETWEDFLNTCKSLRENGWQPLTLDKEDALVAMELHLRRSIGTAEIERLMGKSGHWNQDQAAIAALEQVMTFVQDGNMAYATPADYPAGQNKMALSNSAMMIGTNADCAAVEEATLTDLSWGVFPYPGSVGSGTYMTADMLVISPDCKNTQAAFDFIMLLVSGEFDQLRADIACGIPADPANASPISGAIEALETAQPEPLGLFGSKQLDTAVKLWSAWYAEPSRFASALEHSK